MRVLLFALILCMVPMVMADNLSFATNQSEYYFVAREQSVIPLEVNNSYEDKVEGTLTYTITQEINQAGLQYSSTNLNTRTYSFEPGEYVELLGIGTSEVPALIRLSLSYDYGEQILEMDDILIHFVSNESEKQSSQEGKESSSRESEQSQQEESQPTEPQYQQSPTEQKTTSMQQNMQQDMNSLKQEMDESKAKRDQMQNDFKKNLEDNQKFQDMQQELEDKGYQLDNKSLDANSSDSGDFQYNYEKDGEMANLTGSMKNDSLDAFSQTSEEIKEMQRALETDPEFKKLKKELQDKGYNMQEPQITKTSQNEAMANVPFNNGENMTANITADFVNKTPENIKLHEVNEKRRYWPFFAVVFLVILVLIASRFFKKKQPAELERIVEDKPVNFTKSAKEMLDKAIELFKDGRQKEAYTRVSTAVRFYYRHKLDVHKEMTRDLVLRELKHRKIGFKRAEECLDLCDLVKFAKYSTNSKDFNKIVRIAKEIIK